MFGKVLLRLRNSENSEMEDARREDGIGLPFFNDFKQVLQFSGSLVYKMCGWVLWLLGSLGIAGKILWPFWQKRAAGDQIGKTL